MKHLIYLVSFGSTVYAEMAQVCIDSLLGKGRFRGDIVVVTDGAFAPAPGQPVRTIQVDKLRNRFDALCAKTRFAPLVDVSGYDRVLILDVDLVAIADLEPLFDFVDGCVSAIEEQPFHTIEVAALGDALTDDERTANRGRYGVNAGVVGVDARLFHATMETWARAIEVYRPRANRYVDQPPLNALIVRGEIPFKPYPRGWIELPPLYPPYGMETRVAPDAKILHFCAGDKQEVLGDMRGADELLASLARGETDAMRLAGRDLFFLHAQVNGWKKEAGESARIAEERQRWIDELEAAKQQLVDDAARWQKEAAYQQQQALNWHEEAERRQRIAEEASALESARTAALEAEVAYQRKQALNWSAEAEQLQQQLAQLQQAVEAYEQAKAFSATHAAALEAEAAYQKQQALNWQDEATQLQRLLDQRAARDSEANPGKAS